MGVLESSRYFLIVENMRSHLRSIRILAYGYGKNSTGKDRVRIQPHSSIEGNCDKSKVLMKSAQRDEQGFTLIELLVAMIVGGIVLAAVAAGFVVALQVTGISSTRLSQSDDRQLIEVWLPRDVQSAQMASKNAPANCELLQNANAPQRTAVLVLSGQGQSITIKTGAPNTVSTDVYESDYILTTRRSNTVGRKLTRYYCYTPSSKTMSCSASGAVCTHEVVSYDISSKEATPVAVRLPTVSPGIVTLTLTDSSGDTYSVSGLERS